METKLVAIYAYLSGIEPFKIVASFLEKKEVIVNETSSLPVIS